MRIQNRFTQRTPARHQHRGLSFIEIMLAVLVLVFGIQGTLQILDVNNRVNSHSQHRALAVQLAQMKAAEIQAAGYNAASARLSGNASLLIPDTGAKPFNINPDFKWQSQLHRQSEQQIEFSVNVIPPGDKKPVELLGLLNPSEDTQ